MAHKETYISRQFKTITKKSRGRSGSLLLLVVIILAVSVILITSALAMTLSGRTRYYASSLSSQANLTATSVAKTIGAAVVSGDIKVAELESLAAAGSAVSIPVTSSISATKNSGSAANNSVAPGLAGAVGTSSTTATFSYYPNNTAKTYIKVTITTQLNVGASINQASDTVSILLRKVIATPSGPFCNEITAGVAGSSVNDFPMMEIGGGAPSTGASNYVVVHGDVNLAASGSNPFKSDMIATGRVLFGASTNLAGNMILAGDGASIVDNESGTVNIAGYLLVLGTNRSSNMFSLAVKVNKQDGPRLNTSGTWIVNKAIYVTNKTMLFNEGWAGLKGVLGTIGGQNSIVTYTNNLSSSTGVYKGVDNTSTTVTLAGASQNYDSTKSAIFDAAKAEADKYTSILASNVTRTVMTSAEAFTSGISAYANPAAVRAAIGSSVTLLTPAMMSGTAPIPAASKYCIDLTTAGKTIDGTSTVPAILNFDVTAYDISIYVIGSDSNILTIGQNGLINFKRTSGNNFGKIILLGGCDMLIDSNNTSPHADSGIIGSTHNVAPGPGISTSYVAGRAIFLYIYGMGESKNLINVLQGATLEGYIGLYGTSGELMMTTGGSAPFIYGRYEGALLTRPSGNIAVFPYAPAPGQTFDSAGETGSTGGYEIAGFTTS